MATDASLPEARIRVLLVEDNARDEALIRIALSDNAEPGFHIRTCGTFRKALQLVQSRSYEVVLLNLHLSDAIGLADVEGLAVAAPQTAIIVMTNADNDSLIVKSCELGAAAYVVRAQAESENLSRVIRCAIARKRFEAVLAKQAYFDSLTGLANRGLFNDRLRHALARAARDDKRAALLFIDLDRFKQINDRFGHQVGDTVLRRVADALRGAIRRTDTVARLGGDEFAVLLEPVEDAGDVHMVARKVLSATQIPIAREDEQAEVVVTASIGIAVFPEDGNKAEDLIESADAAMFIAKKDGGHRCHAPDEVVSGALSTRVLSPGTSTAKVKPSWRY